MPPGWPPAPPDVDPAEYGRLADEVRKLLGLDLSQYKAPQVWRRVHSFAAAKGAAGWVDLIARCRTDADLRQAFRDMITINVSEFFRNPEVFELFRARYLIPALRGSHSPRIWSAGCSIGFEPYSVAMLVREADADASPRILATDVDDSALAQARQGRFTEPQMEGVSPSRRARFFEPADSDWKVRDELRSLVTFRKHDLLRDPYEPGLDMIICRNVVIYFTEAAKTELFGRFARALRPGGILFIGATEAIHDARSFGLISNGVSFYERAAA